MTASLAYRSAGPADQPTLVLLHAIATSSAMWEPQWADWTSHFHVVAFDLPGHGASAPLDGAPSVARLAESVAAACDDLGIEDALFVGLSLGSMLAQRLAAERPSLVRAAVLSNGVCATPPAAAEAWRARISAAETAGMASQVDETLARWFTPTFRQTERQTVDRIGDLVRSTSPAGYVFAATAIAGLDQRQLVTRIACPTLVVAGEHDVAAPPAAVKVLADAAPSARFITLPAPHLANVELAATYTQTIGAFLREHAA